MPNTREKLIELFVEYKHRECDDLLYADIENLADHLLANGVTLGKPLVE